ncbi:formate acetyltransferase, partial [Listeria monocytogenes]|uniref:pyruvate formate lyase family protein n=1 Tax=Listeria monocytogenes TaxID=1639 RepID=UPI000D8B7CEE
YVERDHRNGLITVDEAQEIVDHFIMILRLVKFARTPVYNELFSGDPTWVTVSIGGITEVGVPLVTNISFRFLLTLDNFGP